MSAATVTDGRATLRNLTNQVPAVRPAGVVGRMVRSPDTSGQRKGEGGLRLRGRYKAQLPGVPLVSVITVCLNAASTLEQAILSVLRQDHACVEYIVVDGGSEDGTLQILDAHADAIDYFVSEPDDGLYAAMNKGLALACGSHVLVLNADDWYEPDCIASLVRGLQASGADFCSALARRIADDGRVIDVLPSMPYDDSVRFGMPVRHELMLIPAVVYDRVGGYDTHYRIIADFDLAIRLYEAGCTLHEINRPLLNFRVTGVSNTNWGRLVGEHRALLGRQFPALNGRTLDSLADPRGYTADRVDAALRAYPTLRDFHESLLAYAWRRQLYSAQRQPSAVPAPSPVVTVIVPCFNAAATLRRSLHSACSQSLGDLQIICIDDASTDSTSELLKQSAAADSRIKVISNEHNLGVAASRNRALREADGEFVFFLDADDEMMPRALETLVSAARPNHSELVRGRYEKVSGPRTGPAGVPPGPLPASVDLRSCPALLSNTEGFWSYLYRRSFIRNARFLEQLRVGEDSLFLVCALVRARRVTWIADVVYRYRLHDASAMRNFDVRKYLDAVEWRERASRILADSGFPDLARWCACEYWSPEFFAGLGGGLPPQEATRVMERLLRLLDGVGYRRGDGHESLERALNTLMKESADLPNAACIGRGAGRGERPYVKPMPGGPQRDRFVATLRVGVFSTQDKGGAAIGSVRRVELLRARGVNATLYSLVTTKPSEHSRPLVSKEEQGEAWRRLKQIAIDPVMTMSGFRGRELFTMPGSVVDATKLGGLFEALDVVHLHWVVGILDHANFGRMTRGKAVVWTLADMAPFTGGCHYSEGCEEFERECRDCHLLPVGSAIAHENWKIKREAYAKIENLQLICPSNWIAERVARSSLLGERKINVVPNALPVDDLTPVNRQVARMRLGLPLDKKLILFGADSVANKRKGGDLLRAALEAMRSRGRATDVEVIIYGHHRLELPLPTHSLGFVQGPKRLSLAYSAADVYAFPSREDNAPLTVPESLLCGTPVVSFPVGNVPELVKHRENGYLATYGDVADFRAGLDWAIGLPSDPRAAISMIRRCRDAARRHHDPVLAVDRHLAVYHDAVGRNA